METGSRKAIEHDLNDHINKLISLCHRYGTSKFVSGGGGNISWKNGETLWIKASGTYLAGADESTLVAVRRKPLAKLYHSPAPRDVNEREAWANQVIQLAVEEGDTSVRPSVETPLHDLFDAAYVVHTHPSLVNGLTCSKNAESTCRELFPNALWVPYVDPGVTLCLQVKRQFEDYVNSHGSEPEVIIMQNHGLVVASDELDVIDRIHDRIFEVLEGSYRSAGLDAELPVFQTENSDPLPGLDSEGQVALKCTGTRPAPGPLTPDHIVYSGVAPFNIDNGDALAAYRDRFGSDPKLVFHSDSLYAIGATWSLAKLACDLAADGAHVYRLTKAFGGANFMSEEQWQFVVNWEAESYRQSVAESS